MGEIQPPPKLYRPFANQEMRSALRKLSDSMEELAAWMYETAQLIERAALTAEAPKVTKE